MKEASTRLAPVRTGCNNPPVGKVYRHTGLKRFGNGLMTRMVGRGKGPKEMRLVTVRGRNSGKEYSTPILVLEQPGGRYWVSSFGETNTIRNARMAGHILLSRGDAREAVRLVELPVEDRPPLLRAYLNLNRRRMVQGYFDATRESSDAEFRADALDHTVFRLERV